MEKRNIISDLMENIKNMDCQKVLDEILQLEKEKRGIDWRAVFNGSNEYDEKLSGIFAHLNTELGLNMDCQKFKANPIKFLNDSEEIQTVVNYSILNEPENKMIDYVKDLRGKDLAKFVLQMTQKLEFAEQGTSYTQIALEVTSAGLFGVGVEWGVNSYKALKTSANALRACIEGAKGLMTVSKVVAVISLVVIVVLIPFLIFMDKSAEMMMMIVNRTLESIDIRDYYFDHGKLVAKPEDTDYSTGEHATHAIHAGVLDEDFEQAYVGTIYVTKCTGALIGVMGACKLEFSSKAYFPDGVYLGFKTPLAHGDNAGYITAKKYDDAEDFYKKSGKFQLETFEEGDKYHLQACVNSASGGEPVMIAVVESKK